MGKELELLFNQEPDAEFEVVVAALVPADGNAGEAVAAIEADTGLGDRGMGRAAPSHVEESESF